VLRPLHRFLIPQAAASSNIILGNTQVTCHVGVPFCGLRHRDTLSTYLLICTITNIIHKSFSRLVSMRLVSDLFYFPTHPLLYYHIASSTSLTQTQPGKGGLVEGFIRPVHRPSPRGAVDIMSPASTHPIDYRARLTHQCITFLLVMARTSTRL
jgi:hypothetical protein